MAGMFTVCPKCALTLVVTAGDLRVAQGYVRCGRCSNVFNALARLSEDRNAGAAVGADLSPAATPPPEPTPRGRSTAGPSAQPPPAAPPQGAGSPSHRRTPESNPPGTRLPQPGSTSAGAGQEQPAPFGRSARATAPPPAPPEGTLLSDLDDDAIPEDALEFDSTADVNQVFVEPPPNPEWTAATGTFRSLISRSEEPARGAGATASQAPSTPRSRSADKRGHRSSTLKIQPNAGETEIELDADFLSSTAEMRKLQVSAEDEPHSSAPVPSSNPSSSQAQFPPSAKTTQRSLPAEGPAFSQPPASFEPQPQPQPPRQRPAQPEKPQPARLRIASTDTPSQPQPKPPPATEPSPLAEPEVVSRVPPRKTMRAFGLDSGEPPAGGRLAAGARSRATTSAAFELESAHATSWLIGSPTLWNSGVAALVVLLIAQVVNHYRNDLAATPQFNKPITALYSVFGVRLTPRWDLRAYDVRQLGASVDAENAGQIMVRASVKNGGQQAQPLPLLRVTLQDRFGNRIAARDVAPGNYLPRAIRPESLLSAGERIDAEMAFVDPGANAVGFEIDACLPAPAGGIACANDSVSP